MKGTRGLIRTGAFLCVGAVLSGCVTQAGMGQTAHWEIDALTRKCVGAMIAGTALGAIIGVAAGGSRGAAIGAGAGLAAGGATCAVMAALDEQDRARIKAAQLEAAKTGKVQEVAYAGNDGLKRQIRVTPKPIQSQPPAQGQQAQNVQPVSVPAGRICRTVDTSAEVLSKGHSNIPPQRFCRTPAGDWEPVPDDSV